MSDAALFGEQGRREERVEWGLRATADQQPFGMRKGQVDVRPGESSARFGVTDEATRYGWRDCEVVKRTVVTYTSDWEPADADPS